MRSWLKQRMDAGGAPGDQRALDRLDLWRKRA